MFEIRKRRSKAALAGGLLGLLAWTGCAGNPMEPPRQAALERPAVPPGKAGGPAEILQPDRFDAPPETSVEQARRSAEMAEEMTGAGQGGHAGHGSHGGAATYTHKDPGRGSQTGTEEAVYACPMHPNITSKTPGTCSLCGMTLVERSPQ